VTGETVSATHKLPDGSGETLLVVEDQPAVREFAVTVLRSQGYRVLVAPGAVEAMEICRREGSPISLILTDLVMPEMSGTELAKWLEKTRPGAKVLFMSGYAENVVANHVRENERIELIEKPFAPQALIEKVRSLLAEPLARARVLVVDRDAEVRRLLRRALEQAGYVVADFGSAESALQQTAPGSADILLFDMELSANNGIDKVADLRKHARPRTVLGMAPGGDGVGEARPDMDADTVIRKPVNVKELLAVMESWLASRG
jgi:DNA-binding response OmpR family regulator